MFRSFDNIAVFFLWLLPGRTLAVTGMDLRSAGRAAVTEGHGTPHVGRMRKGN